MGIWGRSRSSLSASTPSLSPSSSTILHPPPPSRTHHLSKVACVPLHCHRLLYFKQALSPSCPATEFNSIRSHNTSKVHPVSDLRKTRPHSFSTINKVSSVLASHSISHCRATFHPLLLFLSMLSPPHHLSLSSSNSISDCKAHQPSTTEQSCNPTNFAFARAISFSRVVAYATTSTGYRKPFPF